MKINNIAELNKFFINSYTIDIINAKILIRISKNNHWKLLIGIFLLLLSLVVLNTKNGVD